MEAINWIVDNWAAVIAAIGTIVIAARAIVLLTPTPKDDTILASIVDFLKKVGLHVD